MVLAFVVSASVGAGTIDSTEFQTGNLQTEPESEEPTLRIEPPSENVTEHNATTFLVYLGNPPWNTRPKYVVLRIWSPGYDDLGLQVNGESPDVSFDQGTGWEFHRDLEPGRHAIYTATVGPESRPGNYSIFAAGVYVVDGELATDIVNATVYIESGKVAQPPLWRRVVDATWAVAAGIVVWIRDNPVRTLTILLTAFGVLIAFSQLLIALYGTDRFLAGVRWPLRRVRDDREQRLDEPDQENPK